MFMVSRRVGERIVIGGEVEVYISEIHRSTVKLAVRAPPGHPIMRGEVRDAVARQNQAAAESIMDRDADARLEQALTRGDGSG
jgi:carbon storage regulator